MNPIANPDPHVRGMICLDGTSHTIQIPLEMMYANAVKWFSSLATRFENFAAEHTEDPDFSVMMLELSEQLKRMMADHVVVPESQGMFPQIANRGRLPVWTVDTREQLASYIHYLIEMSSEPDLHRDDTFVFVIEQGRSPELYYTSSLKEQVVFMGAAVHTKLVEARELHDVAVRHRN